MHKHASIGRPRGRRVFGRGWFGRGGVRLAAAGPVFLLGLIVATAPGVAATPCAGTRVSVAADNADDARFACRGVVEAVDFLAERGFTVRQPVFVEVVESIDVVPGASVLGIYDPKADVVKVLARSAFSLGTTDDTVLGLPIDDALYTSIFAHEVAHAVIYQNLGGRKLPFAAHEYLAYAVQLATLSAPDRERVLARFPGAAFTELEQVSEIVLGLDPDRFAVKAYQHFRKLDDQDAVLRRLLADFPAREKEWY
jgi:hypothetical protein